MLWNCLPKHVKGALTLSAFKGLLGDFLNQIPDMPPSTGYTGVNNNSILDWAKQCFVCTKVFLLNRIAAVELLKDHQIK